MQISAALVKALRERTGAGMMECKRALVASDGDLDAAVEQMRKSGLAAADKKASRVAAEGLVAISLSDDKTRAAMVEVNCETDFVAKEQEFRSFVQAVAQRALEAGPPDVESLVALAIEDGARTTIEERRRELVARIGENMAVRRFVTMVADQGQFGSYSHGGRIGVLVQVSGSGESLDDVSKDVAMHVAASRPLCVSEREVPAEVLEKERSILVAQAADSGKSEDIVKKIVDGRLKKFLRETTLLGQPFVKDADLSVEKHLSRHGATVARFARFEVGEGIERKEENFAQEVLAQVSEAQRS